jgi:ABC-type transporter MlaC component
MTSFPPKPKPPHNAFMLFCDRYREDVKAQIIASNSTSNKRSIAPPKDVARRLGERWRSAEKGNKKEFVDRFNDAYTKYKTELQKWKNNREEAFPSIQRNRFEKNANKKNRRSIDPNKPKPPQNPFMRFCNKYRDTVRDQILAESTESRKVAPPKEVARRLGERWRNAETSEKLIFQNSFSEEYHVYRKALDQYKKKNRNSMPQLGVRKRNDESDDKIGRGRKKRPYRTDPNKPRPPHNAFMLFCDRFREDVKKEVLDEQKGKNCNQSAVAPPKEVARRLGKRWREADPDKKQEFLNAFKCEYDRYRKRLMDYTKSTRVAISSAAF